MMAAGEQPQRPLMPEMDPQECRALAEDTERPDVERLVWAVLAGGGELHLIRQQLQKLVRR